MRNMKVNRKLVLAFGIVIFLTLLLGITAIVCTFYIDGKYSESYETNATPLPYIDNIVDNLGQLRIEVRNSVIYANLLPEYAGELDAGAVSKLVEETRKSFEEYTPFIDNDEERIEFNAIKNMFENELVPVANAIMATLDSRDNSQLHELMQKCAAVGGQMTAGLQELMSDAVEIGDGVSAENSAFTNQLVIAFSCLLLVSIAVGVYMMFTLIRLIKNPVVEMSEAAKRIALGDINIDIKHESKDEIGDLGRAFMEMADGFKEQARVLNAMAGGDYSVTLDVRSEDDVVGKSIVSMLDGNNKMISSIKDSAGQVNSGAMQIAQASQNLASGSSEQAATIEQFNASITEIQQQAEQIANTASSTLEDITQAGQLMGDCNVSMEQMNEAMAAISENSQNISKVIKSIDDIAFQTNILALNAAVEAARAGQHGKGFAVVAEEVRSLASKSADAAKETAELIENSLRSVNEGVDVVSKVNESISAVGTIAAKNLESVTEIDRASQSQNVSMKEITLGIGQLSTVVQANSATAEETAASSEEMSAQANVLNTIVEQFTLSAEYDGSRISAGSYSSQYSAGALPQYSYEQTETDDFAISGSKY